MSDLKGKKLLVLGGILSMIEVVKRAKELGITVMVTDYLENSPAKQFADESFLISATDVDAVVQLCRTEKIDGIITGNVDMLLPYYAEICEKADLPCYGQMSHFQIMTNKKEFKELCKKHCVPTIKEYTQEEIEKGNVRYPVLIKPVDSSGSRGITICRDNDELHMGIKKALSFSASKQYIVEKYMNGQEAVLYYYFQHGNPVFMGMCDRYVVSLNKNVAQLSTAYVFPSKYTEKHLKKTNSLIQNMFYSIAMENGTIFLQAFIEDGYPILYEPGYRLNGAREQYIFRETNGINAIDCLISFALTGEMLPDNLELKSEPYLNGKCACMLSPAISVGTVANIEGVDLVRKHSAVKEFIYINKEGDTVKQEEEGTLRQIAYRAFLVEESWEKLKEAVDFVQNNVKYYDKTGKPMIVSFFDSQILNSYEMGIL